MLNSLHRMLPISLRLHPVNSNSLVIRPMSSSSQARQIAASSASLNTRSLGGAMTGVLVYATGLLGLSPHKPSFIAQTHMALR